MADEIDLIRSRINILDLVSQRTAVKKAGRSFKALCPFHDDRNPSMTINPELGRYKCWSCGASGDIFNWVMEIQKVDFAEALRQLADQAGVELKAGRRDAVESKSQKSAQEEIMRAAQAYFVKQLQQSTLAKTYAAQRGLTEEVIDAWGIGYSPDEGSALAVTLKKQGFSLGLAQELFLVRDDGSGGYYDMFRGRLMIPISDERGRIVAFGGRIIGAGQPKYINSSDTPLYHKSDLLFGMDKAKEAIGKKGQAVLVEGYMDVIACHRAGINEAVASLGTALTSQQVRLMKRWASQIVVLYDRDEAGQKAAEKACEMIAEEGLIARVALPPEGQDPDTLLVEKGAAGVAALLDQAVSPIRHRLLRLDEKMKPSDPGYWDEVTAALSFARNDLELDQEMTPYVSQLPNQPNKVVAFSTLRKMVLRARKRRESGGQSPEPVRQDEFSSVTRRLKLMGAERVLITALLKPSFLGVAWRVLKEEDIFAPGDAEVVRQELLTSFPQGAPQGDLKNWIHSIKSSQVADLIAEIAEANVERPVTLSADNMTLSPNDVSAAMLEEAVMKLAQKRTSRQLQRLVLEKVQNGGSQATFDDDELLRISRLNRLRSGSTSEPRGED